MTKQLPARPRVVAGLPVLRRGPGELQIGLDPRHAAVAGNLPEEVIRAAQRLAGHHTGEELLATVTEENRPALTRLMSTLCDRGLLDEAAQTPARLVGDRAVAELRALTGNSSPVRHPMGRTDLAVLVHGDGRLAVTIATLLASAGVGWVHVAAAGTVGPEDVGTGYLPEDVGSPRQVAARRALRQADEHVRTAPFDGDRRPDLVVLTDALVQHPARVAALMSARQPHLLVRVRDTTGIVGPLVVPGLTSCLRCADLHRSERDVSWPHICTQLAGQVQVTDLAGTHATAAFAVSQALAAVGWLRGDAVRPATCDTTVEVDPTTAETRHRPWSAHVSCECGAAERAGSDDDH
jgi:hypothetical protein